MEKIKQLIPSILFVLFCLKSLFISPTASEVAICAILAVISAFFHYVEKITTVKKLEKQVEENNKKVNEYIDAITTLKNNLDSVKISMNMRNTRV
jgi:hypothetical protein